MKRSLLVLAAAAMTLALITPPTQAKDKKGPSIGRAQSFANANKRLFSSSIIKAPSNLKHSIATSQLVNKQKLFRHIQGSPFRTADKLLLNRGTIRTLTSTLVLKDYHLKCGIKHACGICYKGQIHHHWAHRCWLPSCGCECYYDPCTLVYYYWCVPDGCWYPITYCPYGTYVF